MAAKQGFQIDRRVNIAMDALSPGQTAAIKPLLQSKDSFVRHVNRPGMTRRLSASKPTFVTRAGTGMRIIFTNTNETIVVQDIMRKATMDQLLTKPKPKATKKPTAPPSSKQVKTAKLQEV